MKVLIISKEVWRDDQNGGNTLSSLFSAFPSDTEFAQIFCSEGTPDNKICHEYFKLSTSILVSAIRHGDIQDICHFTTTHKNDIYINSGAIGDSANLVSFAASSHSAPTASTDLNVFANKTVFSNIFSRELFREIIWLSGKYKSKVLHDYIANFNPDIIFAPGYGVHYMNHLIQWISSFVTCPIVSLISDDYYTYGVRSFNPFYWLNQLFLRRNIRRSASLYNLVYTMSDEQMQELEKDLHLNVKVLLKSASFNHFNSNKPLHTPIRLIYAGSLYSNRWKTLRSLARAIEDINVCLGSIAISLDIYSGSTLNDKISSFFNSSSACRLLPSVPFDVLIKLYDEYDIALHVEGFDLRSKAKVRMSFSTKIIDCISSGCSPMCICDDKQAGYRYIYSHDLGICVDNPSKIKETLMKIISDSSIINKYRKKAHEFGVAHHSHEVVNAETYKVFSELIRHN